jgi:hypothetical protein
MKQLSILSTSVGIIVGMLIATAIDYKYDLSQIDQPKASFEHPYIYWQDTINRPDFDFETPMDMYENETRDTIYMQLSYGPN